jgi:hypothetical protein
MTNSANIKHIRPIYHYELLPRQAKWSCFVTIFAHMAGVGLEFWLWGNFKGLELHHSSPHEIEGKRNLVFYFLQQFGTLGE